MKFYDLVWVDFVIFLFNLKYKTNSFANIFKCDLDEKQIKTIINSLI